MPSFQSNRADATLYLMKRLRLLGGTVLVISMFWLLGVIFSAPTASAATLNVVAGNDGIDNDNDQCQLSEAIQNINDQAQTNDDCLAGDGNEDTINLPSGMITLTNNLPEITQSITITGQGMGDTTIDGDGLYKIFGAEGGGQVDISISDLTILSFIDFAIKTNGNGIGDINLSGIEIDGIGSDFTSSTGAISLEQSVGNFLVSARDIWIHDITTPGNGEGVFRILKGGSSSSEGTMTVDVENITISDVDASAGVGGTAFVIRAGSPSTINNLSMNGSIRNVTLDGITTNSESVGARLMTVSAMTSNATTTVDMAVDNATMTGLSGGTSIYGGSAAFVAAGYAVEESGTSNINVTPSNFILSDNNSLTDGAVSCVLMDINSLFGGSGSSSASFTSSGGNISDDTSCSSYFTDPTDQNNVDPADLMLGTLGNYGGSIPTIPLLPGSIAIDSGTTVAGLTTDARGVSRPQCSAYDSGAYEYNGTCPVVDNNDTIALTYPDPITSSTVTLELPSDVTNGTVSAIGPTTIPKDTFFSYPLGLTSFQFDTTIGATKTITLYYDLPGDPSSYIPRKYNTNTKTFATIQGATITRVTYNNKSMIKLTYDITDGGTLDQDNIANGTIVDPVGLAAASVGVPETGIR